MGATKRVAEMYVRAAGYSVVRFGNVLGSSGSVVPLFEAQIAKGGPITLTDEDVERYFMTIDEAVELVLLAATGQRATYVLDMGEPVNVGALARDMIRLAGKMPDSEIKVELTGLRPGERLQEELFYPKETVKPSGMGGILVADSMIYSNVGAAIGRLEELVRIGLVDESLVTLWRAVRVGS
jgi:O-antigen biosynthesis protein WbqV